MKIRVRPVRSTILFGLLAALAAIPLITALNLFLPWPRPLALVVGSTLCLYGLLLARWARAGARGICLPLLLLPLLGLMADSLFVFLLLAACVLAWIRSGVCFRQGPRLRAVATEGVVTLGGGALVLSLAPNSTVGWALGLWLYFLFQALYFLLSGCPVDDEEGKTPAAADPFEHARVQAERILSDNP